MEKYRDFEIPVRGQSSSLKVVPFDRLGGFLLAYYSNTVPRTHHFLKIFDFKCAVTLKTGLGVRQGH